MNFWHLTYDLTYNPSLAKIKVDPHAKYQGHMSNGSSRRAQTIPEQKHTESVWHDYKICQKRYKICIANDKVCYHVTDSVNMPPSGACPTPDRPKFSS